MTIDKLSRRQLLQTGLAGAAALVTPALPFSGVKAQDINLGAKRILTLSDGNLSLPLSFLFPDVDKDALKQLLAEYGLEGDAMTPPCNLTLVEEGERLILFDAGAGSNFMPGAGKLMDSFAALGIDPLSVTDVVFTHAHPDHLWGIVDDFDEITFPEANLYMPAVEWDYWRDEDTINKMPEGRQTFAVGAANRLALIEEKITLFKAGDEILPGIEAVDTKGHTPGHSSFALHNGSESLMILGDALTNHAVSFARPDWPSGSDLDAAQGAATRLSLLDRLVADKMMMIGFHLPEGGLGRAEAPSQGSYRFIAGA